MDRGCVGDEIRPPQLCRDYFRNHEIRIPSLNNQYFMERKAVFFLPWLTRGLMMDLHSHIGMDNDEGFQYIYICICICIYIYIYIFFFKCFSYLKLKISIAMLVYWRVPTKFFWCGPSTQPHSNSKKMHEGPGDGII